MPQQLPPTATLLPSPILTVLCQPPPLVAGQPNAGFAYVQANPHPQAAACAWPGTSCLYSHPLQIQHQQLLLYPGAILFPMPMLMAQGGSFMSAPHGRAHGANPRSH
eukprot:2173841-Pleurochrysis_carterae.AAC.1